MKPCPTCGGEGRIVVEGPDYLGRDGNCWRDVLVDEECADCNGSGTDLDEAEAQP
jgi:DnaJ-class molecular chaperone